MLIVLYVSFNDRNTQAEVFERVADLSSLICRFAVFEQVYLGDRSMAQESLKLNLTAALKAVYMAVLKYLVEATMHIQRSSIGHSLLLMACR